MTNSKPSFFLLLCLACSMTAGETAAEWNFGTGAGLEKYPGTPCGATKIVASGGEKFLSVASGPADQQEGYALRKTAPELSPADGFRFVAVFRLRPTAVKSAINTLWDSKYLLSAPEKESPTGHHGFAVYLAGNAKNDSITPTAMIGIGTKSLVFTGRPYSPEPGKKCTLEFSWDGGRTGVFHIDGELNRSVTVKSGGPMSPAIRQAVIGDRSGSRHFPFNGDIFLIGIYEKGKKY